jgi:hypothetical protein
MILPLCDLRGCVGSGGGSVNLARRALGVTPAHDPGVLGAMSEQALGLVPQVQLSAIKADNIGEQ